MRCAEVKRFLIIGAIWLEFVQLSKLWGCRGIGKFSLEVSTGKFLLEGSTGKVSTRLFSLEGFSSKVLTGKYLLVSLLESRQKETEMNRANGN